MSKTFFVPVDFSKLAWLNARLETKGTDPAFAAGDAGLIWRDAQGNVKYNNGTNIVTLRDTGQAIRNGDIATDAAITLSRLAQNPLDRSLHTGTQTASTISDFAATAVSANASALSANATADRNRTNHTGTQLASTISDFATTAQGAVTEAIIRARLAAAAADIAVNNRKITGLADPTADQDATNKRYVDNAMVGLKPKEPVRVTDALTSAAHSFGYTRSGNVLTASINGSINAGKFDGVTTLALGDRVLVTRSLDDWGKGTWNGIYAVSDLGSTGTPYKLTRTADNDTWSELVGANVFVTEGGTYADTGWLSTADQGGTLYDINSPVTWRQYTGAGQIIPGVGLYKNGNEIGITTGGIDGTMINGATFLGPLIMNGARKVELLLKETGSGLAFEPFNGSTSALSLTVGVLTQANLGASSVGQPQLIDGAVALAKLASNSVDSSKLVNLAVTEGKLASSAVTSSKIADNAINLAGQKVATPGTAVSNGGETAGPLPATHGGTGGTSAKGGRTALGAAGIYWTQTHVSATSITITQAVHQLGTATTPVIAQVQRVSTGEVVECDIFDNPTTGDVTFGFAAAPAANTLRFTMMG